MTDENIINNLSLKIVDASVIGKGTEAKDAVNDLLSMKISAELDAMSNDVSSRIYSENEEDDDDNEYDENEYDEEEDNENQSEEDESEN